jgi:Icc-related predicted phosphoesterase
MKIVAISDTHNQHNNLILPDADMLIHAGDVSSRGIEREVFAFLEWFDRQPHQHKIMIAGNHDFYFEIASKQNIASMLPSSITYLENNAVTLDGIKIWGSPISPWFYNWAFNKHRGAEIDAYWQMIPSDADIIITHGPVFGILDKTIDGQHAGCADLLNKIKTIQPKVHVCGHIHEAYGMLQQDGTTFINASVLNHRYAMVNQPIEFII